MVNSKRLSYLALLIVAMIIYTASVIFLKEASNYSILSYRYFIFYILAIMMVGLYSIAWQKILGYFSLSQAYSAKGFVLVFTALWSALILREPLPLNQVIGIAVVIIGIGVVNKNG